MYALIQTHTHKQLHVSFPFCSRNETDNAVLITFNIQSIVLASSGYFSIFNFCGSGGVYPYHDIVEAFDDLSLTCNTCLFLYLF